MKCSIALFLTLALLAGCAKTVSTNLATGQGLVAGRQLGRTAVLVWFGFEANDAKGKKKIERVREIVTTRFARLPGTPPTSSSARKSHASASAVMAWMKMLVVLKVAGSKLPARQ